MLELDELYEAPEIMAQIKNAFEQSGDFKNIKLANFFDDPYQLSDKLQLLHFTKERDPLHHNFEKASLPNDMVGVLQVSLVSLLKEFNLTSLLRAEVFRMTHKSYSMLTDEDKVDSKDTMDIIIDVSDEWDEGFGGDIVYVSEHGEPLEVAPSPNTVFVVAKEANTRQFFKYCNHYSKDYERLFVVLTFRSE